jgi:carbohydrate kinase (thermoresistant glucokinase family)
MKDQTGPAVVTSSALKRRYRDLLREGRPDLRLVYLEGSHDLIGKRLAARHGHFFPKRLLDSQFADLEAPGPDENPLVVSVDGPPEQVVQQIIDNAGLTP